VTDSKAKLKSIGNQATSCLKPFTKGKKQMLVCPDLYYRLHCNTLFINLPTLIVIPDSTKIYKTSILCKKEVFLSMYE